MNVCFSWWILMVFSDLVTSRLYLWSCCWWPVSVAHARARMRSPWIVRNRWSGRSICCKLLGMIGGKSQFQAVRLSGFVKSYWNILKYIEVCWNIFKYIEIYLSIYLPIYLSRNGWKCQVIPFQVGTGSWQRSSATTTGFAGDIETDISWVALGILFFFRCVEDHWPSHFIDWFYLDYLEDCWCWWFLSRIGLFCDDSNARMTYRNRHGAEKKPKPALCTPTC